MSVLTRCVAPYQPPGSSVTVADDIATDARSTADTRSTADSRSTADTRSTADARCTADIRSTADAGSTADARSTAEDDLAADVGSRAALQAEVDQLRQALDTRDRIGQAKGIIRLLTRCDSEAAFRLLAKLSQDTNRRLHDIATEIADCSSNGEPLPPDLARSWRVRVTDAAAAASAVHAADAAGAADAADAADAEPRTAPSPRTAPDLEASDVDLDHHP